MDDIARYNKERWEELAKAKVRFSRPALDLDEASARALVDPEGILGGVKGKDVLCLAGGGGQQSAALALLGARVTVLDLSETQLQRDEQAAEHYGLEVTTVQGDMRNLSCFADDSFDVVWHAHSLNFVPDTNLVFDEVARVIRTDGLYRLECINPFVHGFLGGNWEQTWDGVGYRVSTPYVDGAEMVSEDPYWDWQDERGERRRVKGPREWRHSLGAIVNGLIGRGLVILGAWEWGDGDPEAQPGSWAHFQTIFPPWLTFWAACRPGLIQNVRRSR